MRDGSLSSLGLCAVLALTLVTSMVPVSPTALGAGDPASTEAIADGATLQTSNETEIETSSTDPAPESGLEEPEDEQALPTGAHARGLLPHEDPGIFSPNATLASPDPYAIVNELFQEHSASSNDTENQTLDPTDDPECRHKGQPDNTGCYGLHDTELTFRGGNGSDIGLHTRFSPDGERLYVSLESRTLHDDEIPYDAVTVAYDTDTFDVLWTHRYDGPVHGYDAPIGFEVGPDGERLYLAIASWDGYTDETYGPDNRSGDRYDAVLLALDSDDGSAVWEDRYKGEIDFDVRPTDMALSEDGSRVAVTTTEGSLLLYDAASGQRTDLIALDGTYPAGVDLVPGGERAVVTGWRVSDGAGTARGSHDMVLHGFELPSGQLLWTSVQDTFDTNYLENTADIGWELEVLSEDRIAFAGRVDFHSFATGGDFYVRVVDAADGRTVWNDRIDIADSELLPVLLAGSPSGEELYFAGITLGNEGEGVHALLRGYDAEDGTQRWTANHTNRDTEAEAPVDIEVAPDGSRLYMSSIVGTAEIYDPTTAYFADTESTKLDYVTTGWSAGEGERLFEYRYDGSGHDVEVPFDLSVAPDGASLFTTGVRCLTEVATCWDGDHNDPEAAATVGYTLSQPPNATLTASTSQAQAPATVTFSASAGDVDGEVASWRFDADGDGTPEHSGQGEPPAELTHTYEDGGLHEARLWVNDTEGAIAEDLATVDLAFPAPSAAFTVDPAQPETGEAVTFSSMSTGNLTEQSWTFDDGANASGDRVEHTYADDGTYTVTLTVTDASGRQDTTSRDLSIANRAPEPDLTFALVHPHPGDTVAFTADASDPDGSVDALSWDLAGVEATGAEASRTFAEAGTYEVSLEATDDDGDADVRTVRVQVGLAVDEDAARTDLACRQLHAYCQEWNDTKTDAPDGIDYLRPNDKLPPAVEAEIGPDGATVYRVRTVGEAGGDRHVALTATSAVTNEKLWERTLDAPGSWRAESRGLAVSPDGSQVYVTATTWDHPSSRADELVGYDATTWALDASTGHAVWTDVFDGGDYDAPRLLESSAEDVYVALNTRVPGNATDIALLRLDADTGAREATATVAPYDHLEIAHQLDRPKHATLSADGERLFLTSQTDVFAFPSIVKWEAAIQGFDAETLEPLWSHRYRHPGGGIIDRTPSNPVVDGQGDKVFLAVEDLRSYTMRAFDQRSGEKAWSDHYVYGAFGGPFALASPDGETFYVIGTARDVEERTHRYPREDLWIRALDAETGEIRWDSWYGTDPQEAINPYDAEISPGGTQLYASVRIFEGNQGGQTTTQGEEDVLTLAFDTADGENAFTARHGEALQRDIPYDLEVSPRGDHGLAYGVFDAAGQARYEAHGYFLTVPPEASLTPVSDTGRAPFEATFEIDAQDADGSIESWSLDADGDGEPDAGGQGAPPSTVTHEYTELGSYAPELTVGDDEGASATDTASVEVLPPLPEASLTWTPTYPDVGEEVTFQDTSTSDGGNATWRFGDGNVTTAPVGEPVTHAYAEEGFYTVTLELTDRHGQTDVATAEIQVGNEQPTAAFHLSPEHVRVDEPTTFHQYAEDLDGSVETYRWSFGDGTSATGPDVTHTYTEAGTYDVTLEVVDDRGAVTSITEPVEVHPAPGLAQTPCGTDGGERCATWASGDGGLTARSPTAGLSFFATRVDSGNGDAHVVAKDSRTAEERWTFTYDGAGGYQDTPTAMAASPDGSTLYVTGRTYEENAEGNITGNVLLLALDTATGTLAWNTSWDSPAFDGGTDLGLAVDVAPNGSTVFVAGAAGIGDSFFGDRSARSDLVVLAFDAEEGSQRWAIETDDPHDPDLDTRRDNRSAYAFDIEAGPAGERVHVSGQASVGWGDQHEAVVLSVDADTGAYAWSDADMGAWWAEGVSVEASPSADTVYWGAWKWKTGENKVWVVQAREASTGEVLWAREISSSGQQNDELTALELGPEGQLLVAAGWFAGYKEQAHAVALDPATGEDRWEHDADLSDKDWHVDAAISSGGSRVALFGGTFDQGARTILLDAQGQQLWSATTEQTTGESFDGQIAFEADGRHVVASGKETGFFGIGFANPQSVTYPVTLPPRADPVARPAEQAVDLPVDVQTDAQDPDGAIEAWSIDADGDGIGDATGEGQPPAEVAVSYEEPGTRTPQLRLVDGQGGTTTTAAEAVLVDNAAPTIEADDTYTVTAGELAEISANASDPDGDTVTWSVSGDEELDNVQTAVDANGTLTWSWSVPLDRVADVPLTVTAHDAYHDVSRSLTVDVQALPEADVLAPVEASTGTSSGTVLLEEDTLLRGVAEDPDGTIVSATFHPEGLGGPEVSAEVENGLATASYDYNTTGQYDVVLTVEDDEGLTRQAQRTVTVTSNVAPTADAGTDTLLEAPGTVRLDGTGSLDPEGRPLSYTWSLPDGTTATGSTPSFTAPAGVHRATLTVMDTAGAIAQDTVNVTVDDALYVEAALLDEGPVGPRERPTVAVAVWDDQGTPRAGANVTLTVEHPVSATDGGHEIEGVTDGDGRLLVRLPYDVEQANVPGEHKVTVEAEADSRASAPLDDAERAITGLAYTVEAAG